MQASVTTTGLDSVIARVKSLASVEKQLQPILKVTALELVSFARECINGQHDATGVPYAPLAESTIAKIESAKPKRKPPFPILKRSGRMVRGLYARVESNAIIFGDTKGYAAYHQGNSRDHSPTGKIPRRSFYPLTERLGFETRGIGGEFWKRVRDKIKKIA